ncbi:P27 family phage terminase small subunit [Thioalkalivibrio thiocyanodenitrificans]|uniref:P27 family phage terminase small subunit n=1 Tax=Thioalkalivibrio thiocyanodenitrificans TaxID=243063 RepID=UPI000360BF55|nr:P27 family phage terminase small subunit [Thioalkalivibrio thiocyanodenitrificans]
MKNRFAPPETLAAPEADIFVRLRDDFDIQDAPGLVLLHQLCRAHQLAREAREIVAREGLVVDGKAHPLLATIRDAEKQLAATMRQMNFDVEPLQAVGRPPMVA